MKPKKLLLIALVSLTTLVVLSGCGKAKPTVTEPENPAQQISTQLKASSIIDQVRESQHFKMFPTLINEKEKDANFDYSDLCLRCHSETAILKDPNAKLTDFFKGGKYATDREGITCLVCHNVGGEEMISLRKLGWETCTTCHTSGDTVTLGKEVHHSQKEMIEGIGVGVVPTTPSYKWVAMKDSFSCTDCHVTNGVKHDFMVPGVTATYDDLGTTRTGTKMDYAKFADMFKQDKCVTCHYDPSSTISKIQQRQTEISQKIEALKPKFDSWEKKVQSLDPKDPKVVQFNAARTYYMYVTSDASKGAHNYALSKALLQQAEIEINKLN
ncbi:hypothetical protein [Desulfitobacterium sp.]|uniref:hypothetical protein n=1 Tax=Desulfitobacterium sp. TaxID=49981 RepID=UPI002B210729|nr:hypothetical protein [Desulfitobacterium sp.]MEA4901127.1 hypothetical protein [Desulfitobacterium sp.]